MESDFDVLIIGSGFGGCITACILAKIGYRVCIVDKAKHPRFAIGESSTPLADRTLKRIAERYGLDWLLPLTTYGTAQEIADEVTVGLKRGFSYFQHHPGKAYRPSPHRSTELLVAASTDDSISDTHWLRSTVDHYIARNCSDSNSRIRLIENFHVHHIERSDHWRVTGSRIDTQGTPDSHPTFHLTSRFIIDASGGAEVLRKVTGQQDMAHELVTHTSAIFGHFRGLEDWNEIYTQQGGDDREHPYRSDRAAVHHLIDEGWMWQLGFDNGVTSCGIVLNHFNSELGIDLGEDPVTIWRNILRRYPSLEQQFSNAERVAPERFALQRRLQSLHSPAAGVGWLGLPSAIGFVDPLHSTGIAHTLSAIERIGEMFSSQDVRSELPTNQDLAAYSEQLNAEIRWIDQLVSIAYAASFDFSLFAAATMTYFVVVTNAERDDDGGFLATGSRGLTECVRSISDRVFELRNRQAKGCLSDDEVATSVAWIRGQVRPFNHAGLMDPSKKNLYHHTAPIDKTI